MLHFERLRFPQIQICEFNWNVGKYCTIKLEVPFCNTSFVKNCPSFTIEKAHFSALMLEMKILMQEKIETTVTEEI